jgi:serine/threonine-protein kinase RsbW
MINDVDIISLTLPFKAEYVSTARLLTSGMANRLGFDIDTIEDIKVAVSEVCSKFVKIGSKRTNSYRIEFEVSSKGLNIVFYCEDENLRCIFDGEDDGLGAAIINALMDEVEFCTENRYILSMLKAIERKSDGE